MFLLEKSEEDEEGEEIINYMSKELEDKEFVKRTKKAWEEIEVGRGISMEFDEFIKEMKRW